VEEQDGVKKKMIVAEAAEPAIVAEAVADRISYL
jgi:hypothetical protein